MCSIPTYQFAKHGIKINILRQPHQGIGYGNIVNQYTELNDDILAYKLVKRKECPKGNTCAI